MSALQRQITELQEKLLAAKGGTVGAFFSAEDVQSKRKAASQPAAVGRASFATALDEELESQRSVLPAYRVIGLHGLKT